MLLDRAHRAMEQKPPDHVVALRYFHRYLAYQPDDVDARAEYGLMLDKYTQNRADCEQALLELDAVLRRDPSRTQVRFRLMHCLITLGRLPEAIEQAEKLLPEWDNKAELQHILGWCCEAEKKNDEAAEWFRKAIVSDPKRIESYALLADILRQNRATADKALDVMDALVTANPDSFRAYLLRRRTLLLLSKDERPAELALAEKDLRQAIKLAPEEPDVVLAAAESAQTARQDGRRPRAAGRGAQARQKSKAAGPVQGPGPAGEPTGDRRRLRRCCSRACKRCRRRPICSCS